MCIRDSLYNAFRNARHGHGDAIICGALLFNDAVGAVPHIFINFLHGGRMVKVPAKLAEMVQANARDIGTAPHCQLAVAVFANYHRMHAARCV